MPIQSDGLPSTPISTMSRRNKIFFLLVVPLFLYVVLLPVIPLTEPDESRYSDIPSLMNHSGDYVTPRLNHVVYLEKPPLAYWATALFFKVFGESEFSSRLFSGLCAWGCVLLVYAMGARLYNEKTGLYSAAVLSTFLYHFILGRLNLLDVPLAFFVSLGLWAGFLYFDRGARRKPRTSVRGQGAQFENSTLPGSPALRGGELHSGGRTKKWIYLLYFSSALAFLTKGLVGILFPFGILAIWLASQRRWRDLLRFFNIPGILLFLATAAPWVILVQKANPGFLRYFFIRQHVLRYTTDAYGHVNMLYYLPILILGTVPWLAFFIEVLWKSPSRRLILGTVRQPFLLTWTLFIFVFFSISSSKMATYIVPVFLPVAVLFGRGFRIHEDEKIFPGKGAIRGFLQRLPVLIQSVLFVVALCLPPFLKEYAVPLREWWPLLVLPVLTLVLILFLPGRIYAKSRKDWFPALTLLTALFLGSLVFPLARYLAPHKSSLPVARAVREFVPAGQELYQYRIYLRGINFYCKTRTPIVGRPDEIATGRDLLPPEEKARYFLSVDKFFQTCNEKDQVYCITKGEDKFEQLKMRLPHLKVIWRNSAFYLLELRSRPSG
jgi:4-amino-4-deoxy-L-arabinose transferase-like glycosyltransferase